MHDQSTKTVQLFGTAFERSVCAARINALHHTAVACDEAVRAAVESAFPCKPIEILGEEEQRAFGGGKVYELIHGHVKGVALDVKLAAYRTAFELYEMKRYREALKQFRLYTKQYGYDRSVERMQLLISGTGPTAATT